MNGFKKPLRHVRPDRHRGMAHVAAADQMQHEPRAVEVRS
jgi:hypothetical protein